MASGRPGVVLKHLHAIYDGAAVAGLTDGQLLERFLARQGEASEAAFAALVERHGPMVRHVCRAVLRDAHDADDAAQAVFFVLARRARAIRRQDSVGSWLYGVALRLARRERADAARRAARERRGAEMVAQQADKNDRREDWSELYEELGRLPEVERAPLVLCDLEGLTHEEAARLLRGSVRTVQRRLARGRQRLRERLARRGFAFSAATLAAETARAAVPHAWAEATVKAAMSFAAGGGAAAAGSVPATAAALAEGALKAMALTKLKVTAATSAALLTACLAAGALAQQASKTKDPTIPRAGTSVAVAPATRLAEPKELAHDDGKAAGKRSIAGSGHAVRFEAPGDDWSLTSVRLHGARYGYPKPPDEDFHIYLCDDQFKKLADFPFPYSKFERGQSKWVKLDVKPTKVPKTFVLCVSFNPEQTKGVYLSHDAEAGDTSFVGLPDGEMRPFDKGDWMIRAHVEQSPAGASGKSGR